MQWSWRHEQWGRYHLLIFFNLFIHTFFLFKAYFLNQLDGIIRNGTNHMILPNIQQHDMQNRNQYLNQRQAPRRHPHRVPRQNNQIQNNHQHNYNLRPRIRRYWTNIVWCQFFLALFLHDNITLIYLFFFLRERYKILIKLLTSLILNFIYMFFLREIIFIILTEELSKLILMIVIMVKCVFYFLFKGVHSSCFWYTSPTQL